MADTTVHELFTDLEDRLHEIACLLTGAFCIIEENRDDDAALCLIDLAQKATSHAQAVHATLVNTAPREQLD